MCAASKVSQKSRSTGSPEMTHLLSLWRTNSHNPVIRVPLSNQVIRTREGSLSTLMNPVQSQYHISNKVKEQTICDDVVVSSLLIPLDFCTILTFHIVFIKLQKYLYHRVQVGICHSTSNYESPRTLRGSSASHMCRSRCLDRFLAIEVVEEWYNQIKSLKRFTLNGVQKSGMWGYIEQHAEQCILNRMQTYVEEFVCVMMRIRRREGGEVIVVCAKHSVPRLAGQLSPVTLSITHILHNLLRNHSFQPVCAYLPQAFRVQELTCIRSTSTVNSLTVNWSTFIASSLACNLFVVCVYLHLVFCVREITLPTISISAYGRVVHT